jgi:hypothetical protein
VARTSEIVRRLLAGVVLLGTLLAGAAFAARSASASSTPVVYATQNDGWQHGSTRPGRYIFGNGGAPFFTALKWKSWGSGSAWGTGKLWTQKPGCSSASYKCPYSPRWVGVYLSTVRTHNGVRYYARMAVEFFVSGRARWVTGWFAPHGGTMPYWGFPAVFPYL